MKCANRLHLLTGTTHGGCSEARSGSASQWNSPHIERSSGDAVSARSCKGQQNQCREMLHSLTRIED